MKYIYSDEDNAPMNDFDVHNPTVYPDAHTARMFDRHGEPDEKPSNGCWNCMHFDPWRYACTLTWNNLDESYYNPDTDDRDLTDCCEEHEIDPDADWKDYFGGNEP